MNDSRFLIAAAILLIVVPFIFARGAKDSASAVKTVRVTGTVRLVGTDIFSEIVISSPEGEWYIEADEKEKLHSLQHRTVTVEGTETIIQLTFAGGFPAGNRYVLSNIVVIKVE
ncbi:MAG: hypothetical protein LBU88_07895 [Treponema sp.]|jgi:hypothetical protein|nr:hypothetical protein [Treponema sp.]